MAACRVRPGLLGSDEEVELTETGARIAAEAGVTDVAENLGEFIQGEAGRVDDAIDIQPGFCSEGGAQPPGAVRRAGTGRAGEPVDGVLGEYVVALVRCRRSPFEPFAQRAPDIGRREPGALACLLALRRIDVEAEEKSPGSDGRGNEPAGKASDSTTRKGAAHGCSRRAGAGEPRPRRKASDRSSRAGRRECRRRGAVPNAERGCRVKRQVCALR